MAPTLPTLLVLADPGEPQMRMLEPFRDRVRIVISPTLAAAADTAALADAILVWTASRELLQQVFALAPQVRWLHSRSAGLDTLLFPALVDSREVWLCWRLGEPAVAWWHEHDTGVAGRRRVSDLA